MIVLVCGGPEDREVFLPPHNENATCGVKSRPKLFLSHVRLRSSKIEKDVYRKSDWLWPAAHVSSRTDGSSGLLIHSI